MVNSLYLPWTMDHYGLFGKICANCLAETVGHDVNNRIVRLEGSGRRRGNTLSSHQVDRTISNLNQVGNVNRFRGRDGNDAFNVAAVTPLDNKGKRFSRLGGILLAGKVAELREISG